MIAYRNYLLALLLVILAFNFVDRLALGLVLQDIKADLHLSDTQLGLLSGLAFALFYSLVGVPIGRWADRGNRITIISLTTVLWSAAVSLCGLAGGFAQLLLIRVGVAVGEAGCIPPAHSLIADHFTRAERPRAVAIYMLGGPISFVVGYFLAGWLNEFYGWRTTFLLLGLPGLALAALSWFTLREPRKEGLAGAAVMRSAIAPAVSSSRSAQGLVTPPSWKETFTTLWSNGSFRHLLLCLAVIYFFGFGVLQWKPAFFIRSYGLQTGTLGTWLAIIYGVCGIAGTYLGGELATRYAAHNERLQLRAVAVGYCAFGILSACIYISPNQYVAFGFLAVSTLGVYMTNGPLFATIQTLVPARMRAVSIAIIYLFANLIGMGLGPLAAGVLSDMLRPLVGEQSLRYALLILCPGYFWAAWHLWCASRTVVGDVEAVQIDRDRSEAPERPVADFPSAWRKNEC